jgi:hypothetical protein
LDLKDYDYNSSKKHAILITTHSNVSILKKIISIYDDPRIDFFIHVDIKKDKQPFVIASQNAVQSSVFFLEQYNINWGGYSQIKCEIALFKRALSIGRYEYFHLISGSDFPLKSKEEFLDFFKLKTANYLSFDNAINGIELDRVRYYHPLTEIPIFSRNKFGWKLDRVLVTLQRIVNITRSNEIVFYKGTNWCSLYEDFVKELVDISKSEWFKKTFYFTLNADEIYKQTILQLLISEGKKFQIVNDSLRYVDWSNGGASPKELTEKDFSALITTSKLFGRKFSENNNLINCLYKELKN